MKRDGRDEYKPDNMPPKYSLTPREKSAVVERRACNDWRCSAAATRRSILMALLLQFVLLQVRLETCATRLGTRGSAEGKKLTST